MPGKLVIGYLASWKAMSGAIDIAALPGRRLTHLLYAFGQVSSRGLAELSAPCAETGQCRDSGKPPAKGPIFAQLTNLKRKYPHLKIIVSFGGWTGSKYFSMIAATPAGRRRFAGSVLDRYFRQYPGLFDGVDLDWEYPVSGGLPSNLRSADDSENLVLLLATLRRSLDRRSRANGRPYTLAIAATGEVGAIANLKLPAIAKHVDWIGIMAYDFYAGSSVAGFNAPLFRPRGDPSEHRNVDAVVSAYLRAGAPPHKLVLGIPFYGRAVGGLRPIDKGRFQSGAAKLASSWGGLEGIDFRELMDRRPEKAGFHRYWDPTGTIPWLFNSKRGIFISYENARSVSHKAAYARLRRLGGVMVWELGADKNHTLIRATSRSFLGVAGEK